MPIHRKIFEELLQQPLGPYRDCDILHETECQMKGGTQLVLYSFILEHDGHLIGLDESERPLDDEIDDRSFRFRGVLKITNPGWLSDFGLKTVETELNLRAQERALREGERNPAQLTLDGLFDAGLLTKSRDSTWRKEDNTKLTVLIQGEKNMPATFMQSSLVPNGLLWSSKAHDRMYQVATMDVDTYSLSENFFWRWRLLVLMEKISKQFLYIPSSKRTPIWFVDKYLAVYACPPEDKHYRLIFSEDDSDVDETGRTVISRHLLKPHTSEILGLFAAHADWLITHNEVKRKRLFDTSSWKEFAKRVKRERREAARHSVRWGWAIGQNAEAESSEEGPSSEEDAEESKTELAYRLAREQPVIGKTNKVLTRKLEIALSKPSRDRKASVSSSSGSEAGDGLGGAVYASDFSDPSDVEENDEGYRHAEDEVVDHIPWQLQLPALLPDVDGRWWCPLPLCDYQIDLHELPEEDRRRVPQIGYIMQKQWRNAAYDDKVLEGFGCLVFGHYLIHLEERGVKVEMKNGKRRFAFINDRPRQPGGQGPIRGPMPALGTLGGESRVIPTLHAPHARRFQ